MRRKRGTSGRAQVCRLAAVLAASALYLGTALPAEAAPKVYPDGGIFDAAYYAKTYPEVTACGTSEEDLYRNYETVGAAQGKLRYDPAAPVYFLEGEPAGTILPEPVYTDEQVTEKILALRDSFPEGLSWKGGTHLYNNLRFPTCGAGCVSFAMQISDLVFGTDAKVVRLAPEQVSEYHPGDILRVRNNTHSVVVVSVDGSTLTLCEGNYRGEVHWGRKIDTSSLVGNLTYVERRWIMDPASCSD